MSVLVPLTRGQFAIIDDEDAERVLAHKWHAHKGEHANTFYAFVALRPGGPGTKQKRIRMHRFILNDFTSESIDHIDGNGLNNQKANLRVCAHQQNMYNKRMYKNNVSGYPGVRKEKGYDFWRAEISVNKKTINLGCFKTREEAVSSRQNAEKLYWGDFAPKQRKEPTLA